MQRTTKKRRTRRPKLTRWVRRPARLGAERHVGDPLIGGGIALSTALAGAGHYGASTGVMVFIFVVRAGQTVGHAVETSLTAAKKKDDAAAK